MDKEQARKYLVEEQLRKAINAPAPGEEYPKEFKDVMKASQDLLAIIARKVLEEE